MKMFLRALNVLKHVLKLFFDQQSYVLIKMCRGRRGLRYRHFINSDFASFYVYVMSQLYPVHFMIVIWIKLAKCLKTGRQSQTKKIIQGI